jgi:hypothetical protein
MAHPPLLKEYNVENADFRSAKALPFAERTATMWPNVLLNVSEAALASQAVIGDGDAPVMVPQLGTLWWAVSCKNGSSGDMEGFPKKLSHASGSSSQQRS